MEADLSKHLALLFFYFIFYCGICQCSALMP
jgi:hypothetical protein